MQTILSRGGDNSLLLEEGLWGCQLGCPESDLQPTCCFSELPVTKHHTQPLPLNLPQVYTQILPTT